MAVPTETSFTSWADLIDAIRADYAIRYQGPVDYRSHAVTCTIRKDGKIRVSPIFTDADPFTADRAHLDRFRKLAKYFIFT